MLPSKFKRTYSDYDTHLKELNLESSDEDEIKSEEYMIVKKKLNEKYNEIDEILSNQTGFITRELIHDINTNHDKIDLKLTQICKKAKIDRVTPTNNDNNNNSDDDDKITLRKGAPTKEEHEYLKERVKKNYREIRQIFRIREEKLDTNSPQTVEDWMRLINGLESFIQMFDPLINDRYQRHWLAFAQIAKNYIEHGGSAASSMSKVDTYILNKRTGKPEKRGITKEHIDGKIVEWIDAFVSMMEGIPIFFEEMCKFDNTERTERATRSVEIEDKLSEAA